MRRRMLSRLSCFGAVVDVFPPHVQLGSGASSGATSWSRAGIVTGRL
jgi:hypothetical protein